MKTKDIIYFTAFIAVTFIVFLIGYHAGISDIRKLEDAGYEIVNHEVRHGEFTTNWVEVIKKGETK